MKLILVIYFLVTPFIVFTQTEFKGKIIDEDSGQPLEGANIVIMNNDNIGTSTDEYGFFKITVNDQQWSTITLKITYMGYDSVYVKLSEFWSKNTDIPTFSLQSKSFQLGDATIKAPLPDTVHGSKVYSIQDFEFVGDDLLLLTYKKTLKRGAEIRLIDQDTKEELSKYFSSRCAQKVY